MKSIFYVLFAIVVAIAGCIQPPDKPGRLSCSSDDDCANEFSCCHRGNNECINKDYIEEADCSGVACTEECRPCNICKCRNNVCQAESHDALEGYCC